MNVNMTDSHIGRRNKDDIVNKIGEIRVEKNCKKYRLKSVGYRLLKTR